MISRLRVCERERARREFDGDSGKHSNSLLEFDVASDKLCLSESHICATRAHGKQTST